MSAYLFESAEFGMDEKSIHLLRSGFAYESINYTDIYRYEIKRDHVINNWLVLFLLGLILLSFGIVFGVAIIYNYFISDEGGRFHIYQFAVPVLPLIIGPAMIHSSIKKGPVLKILYNGKSKRLSLMKSEIDQHTIQVHLNKYCSIAGNRNS